MFLISNTIDFYRLNKRNKLLLQKLPRLYLLNLNHLLSMVNLELKLIINLDALIIIMNNNA